mmetsp:Transcript_39739/g.79671  ORF Transcript_39739/g.79671 Transcript_39739/m.79671 type:complete len:207 (-) Transcript_39739:18-638(-)
MFPARHASLRGGGSALAGQPYRWHHRIVESRDSWPEHGRLAEAAVPGAGVVPQDCGAARRRLHVHSRPHGHVPELRAGRVRDHRQQGHQWACCGGRGRQSGSQHKLTGHQDVGRRRRGDGRGQEASRGRVGAGDRGLPRQGPRLPPRPQGQAPSLLRTQGGLGGTRGKHAGEDWVPPRLDSRGPRPDWRHLLHGSLQEDLLSDDRD